MKKLASTIVVAVGLVVAATVPSQARENHDSHVRAVEHRAVEHRGFDERHRFEERHGFGRWGVAVPYGGYVTPGYASEPAYAYYCPTYGGYYPDLATCPVPWVAVPTGG
jgi:hypothetical protein